MIEPNSALCPSCHGSAGEERFHERAEVFVFPGHSSRYFLCARCHAVFQYPQLLVAALPPDQQACETVSQNPLGTGFLAKLLGRWYYLFTRGWFFSEALKKAALEAGGMGRKDRKGLRLLDVGAGIGLFCQVAGEWFETVGLEPSLDACRIGRRDLEVDCLVCGEITPGLFRGEFEIVTFWQTIEHISGSPREALFWAYDRLAPGGMLFLGEIPDFTSFEFALFKGDCKFLSSPLHNFLFTPRFFEETLREAGFSEVRIQYDWRNYSLFSQSLLGRLEKVLGRKLPGKGKLVLSLLLLPFMLAFNLFLARKKRSATFSVLAVR